MRDKKLSDFLFFFMRDKKSLANFDAHFYVYTNELEGIQTKVNIQLRSKVTSEQCI